MNVVLNMFYCRLAFSLKSENSRPKKLKETPKTQGFFMKLKDFVEKLNITGKLIFTNNLLELKIKFTYNAYNKILNNI